MALASHLPYECDPVKIKEKQIQGPEHTMPNLIAARKNQLIIRLWVLFFVFDKCSGRGLTAF